MSNPYAPSEAEPIATPASGYLPNRTRALVLQRLLQASIVFDGLSFAASWAEGLFEEGSGAGLVALGWLGQTAVYFVCIVAWLAWEYRAHKNLPALGAVDLQHTPGATIIWWFVPFANLVRPLQVMTEIWEASAAQAKGQPGPDLVITAWWGAWIASNLAANFAYGSHGSPDEGTAWVVANTLSLVAGVLALNVVRSIDEAQAAAAAERGFTH